MRVTRRATRPRAARPRPRPSSDSPPVLAIVPLGLTVPAPPTPSPLPTVVLVVDGVVTVVDGAVVAVVAVGAVVDEAPPGMVVLTVPDPRMVVLTVPDVTVVEAPVLLLVVLVLATVVLVEVLVDVLVEVVLEALEATSLLPRSPGWTIATAVPATKSRPEAPRMSLWVAFRARYLARSGGLGWGLVGAGDGNRTRTTSLEGWGSSR